MKETDDLIQEAEAVLENKPPAAEKAVSEKAPSSHKGKKKPAWATTEKQQEEMKEAEIDELLEFAYELDYEKYMEDFDVRQALAVIKERVQKIKEEPDWKEQMANEWNEADKAKDADKQSHASYSKCPFFEELILLQSLVPLRLLTPLRRATLNVWLRLKKAKKKLISIQAP